MGNFLILGEPADTHAQYVSWALGIAGYKAEFVNSGHDSAPIRADLYFSDANEALTSVDWSEAEAVWSRRFCGPPLLPDDYGENEGFAIVQENRFTNWLIEMQERSCDVRWINLPSAAIAAENKFIQLKMARSHGLRIPRTLVTAKPDRFRAFLREEGEIVAKPLTGYSWEYQSGETLTAFASIMDAQRGSELSDEDIAQCVTIYQQRIDKVADVRLVVMGQEMFAYRVVQDGEQHFDFRVGFFQENHLRYEEVAVPSSLKQKVLRFMDSIGLNFASADFAMTANGEFVFLDLNPNGQWLFIEAATPANRVGQKFCSFFISGRVDPGMEKLFPSYSEFTESDTAKSTAEAFRRNTADRVRPTNTWKQKHAEADLVDKHLSYAGRKIE